MVFWIVIALIALAVAALLAIALVRGGANGADAASAAAFDLKVYRDQLREVDRDLARGVIAEADADRVRTEISRRILAADARARESGGDAPSRAGPRRAMAVIVVLIIAGGSLALYRELGVPGYGDLSLQRRIAISEELREARISQDEAETLAPARQAPEGLSEDYLNLVKQLREKVAERPDDLTGHALLARHEAATGDLVAARKAQQRVVELKGGAATAEDYAELADLMILATGGYVTPEAENALRAALQRNPKNGPARYYWGLMRAQTGRPDLTFRVWEQLLREGPVDAPWMPPVREQIGEVAALAGIDFTPPPAPGAKGPSAADVAAASEMSAEDRQQMIRTMVEGLSDRLANEGGPPEDWARLITSLGVLGETENAKSIYAEARTTFADDSAALAQIDGAARQAGILE